MLRDYQQTLYERCREKLSKTRCIFLQLATGGGKTAIFSSMCGSVFEKKKRAWIIVPRNELVIQASNHLRKWQVPHGMITAKSTESRAFRIHVVSKDTLIRRYDKIKNWPDLLIFDEGHLYLDRQIEIVSRLPETSKVISFSATPERLDGRGLSELYECLIEGPSIPWLTERGFLTPLRYFSPPLDGLDNIHKRGTELDEEQLDELLKRRKVYGELVGHYEKYGKGKAALIFCRSVKSAYQTAERFRDKGFNFHCIEGKMSEKRRKDLIEAHRRGEIDGLTNCDLATYGLDIPRIEYGASIRPTLSRSLYFQKIGRILRPYEESICPSCKTEYQNVIICPSCKINNNITYRKEEALFFDHVNLVLEHQEDSHPGVPPHYVPHIEWNFTGTEKRKRKKKDINIRLCPHMDYMYCQKKDCTNCKHNPDAGISDARKPMIVIPTELVEKKQLKYGERPIEERREFQDRINNAIMEFNQAPEGEILSGPVAELLKIAAEFGYGVLWVYWRLTTEKRKSVNVPLLYEIGRQCGYKSGWAYHKKKEIRFKLEKKQDNMEEYREAMG